MKFVILDNTAWTTHFVVLQSISRAAETASVTSRRTTERLVRWTHPTSSLPPSSLYVRAAVCDDTLRAPLQIFFAAPLRRYPYDGCGNFTRTCAHLRRCRAFDARNLARSSFMYVVCHISPPQKRRRPHVAGVVRYQMGYQMGIDARHARIRRFPNRPRHR